MSLPKLETPVFKLKLPSTGEIISYRPFLVKEEKLLLMMTEGTSNKERIDFIKQLITSCIKTEINFDALTVFDIEYIFINLRSKSVGQEVSLMAKCSKCNHQSPISLDLDSDISIENLGDKKKNKDKFTIKLGNNVGMILKYPSFSDIGESILSDDAGDIDTKEVLIKCIDSIYDNTTVYKLEDYTKEEVIEFIESLSIKDLEGIKKFFLEMPKVKCKTNFVCSECKEENNLDVEGIASFF